MPDTTAAERSSPSRGRRHRPLRAGFASVLVTALLAAAGALPAVADSRPAAPLTVMTQNLCFGADLAPVFSAGRQGLIDAVTAAYQSVQDTDFRERARSLAGEIARRDPHLVGLQEAALWRSQTPSGAGSATHVEYDFAQILLRALAARGRHYAVVASVTNGDYEAPRKYLTGLQDVRLTDRDVLLARTDLPAAYFSVGRPRSGRFAAQVQFTTPALGTVVVPHGWVSVDATVRGRTTRVVSTHLENLSPAVQAAQAEELLAGPLNTRLPGVLMGDLNSAAGGVGAEPGRTDTHTYADLLAAGFTDAWTVRHRRDPGFTCCQAADLHNAASTLRQRIDYVLFRGGLSALAARRVGAQSGDRTPSGLWPSDHAGVWSALRPR